MKDTIDCSQKNQMNHVFLSFRMSTNVMILSLATMHHFNITQFVTYTELSVFCNYA